LKLEEYNKYVARDSLIHLSLFSLHGETMNLTLGWAVHARAPDAAMDEHLFFPNVARAGVYVRQLAKCKDLCVGCLKEWVKGKGDVVSLELDDLCLAPAMTRLGSGSIYISRGM